MADAKERAAPGRPSQSPTPTRRPAESAEVSSTVAVASVISGCPCGCLTRLPFFDDPDCLRYKPMPEAVEWIAYDLHDLGLESHDRRLCARCQAVGL